MKKMIRKSVWFFVLISSTTACFEYNANQIILDDDQKNLTAKNLERIKKQVPSETVRIVLMGDTQRFYDEAADFVTSVNQLENIDFVVHAGDISDFGLDHEFKWVEEILSALEFPYLTVIGNHDLLANGRKVYAEMYGPTDYSFEYGGFHFIMLNTNSREYGFNGAVPDLEWLADQLNAVEGKPTVVISHVPPFDGDFDDSLEGQYAQLLAENNAMTISLHGHTHSFMDSFYYGDGVRYFVTTSVGKNGYAVIELSTTNVNIQTFEY